MSDLKSDKVNEEPIFSLFYRSIAINTLKGKQLHYIELAIICLNKHL